MQPSNSTSNTRMPKPSIGPSVCRSVLWSAGTAGRLLLILTLMSPLANTALQKSRLYRYSIKWAALLISWPRQIPAKTSPTTWWCPSRCRCRPKWCPSWCSSRIRRRSSRSRRWRLCLSSKASINWLPSNKNVVHLISARKNKWKTNEPMFLTLR